MNGADAFRLKLMLPLSPERAAAEQLAALSTGHPGAGDAQPERSPAGVVC